ncbi:helix-turn-helix domain-containing protein, partial [uncultured Duncaniella sp.]
MEQKKKIILSSEERTALEKAYRFGSCHRFRMRCKAVLMKADNVKVSTISEFVGYGKLAVYDWLRRYRRDGLDGLREKGGRGVKPLMDLS